MLTKVKLRQKPLADGKLSLYLDFYPPIADPVTGKKTRREFLQLHIWEKPKGSLQRQHNADTLFVAEQIRFERENALLKSNIYSDLEKEHIAYLERSEKKFIEYYEESFKDKPLANWYRYSGAFYLLKKFCPKDIKFKDITLKWCENFRNFVLRADSLFHEGKTLAQTTRHNYFRCFRTILLQAFNEGYLRENLNAKLECIPRKDRPRQFLSVSELNQLIQTPCSKDNLKRAALFSALTGLRFGDIQALTWEKLEHQPGEGYYLNFTMRKTGGIMRLPISEQAVELMGNRGKYGEYVFPKLSRDPLYRQALREWVYDAGIQKHISFHCFRHSFATNQLTAGTDITTVSKMLGHSDLKTTMIYAKVVDNVKREAADRVKLEF